MKRFYKTVTVVQGGGGWQVQLDGRPVKTPAKAPLTLPTQALAAAIAAEWEGQGAEVVPETMPLTPYVCSALDRVAPAKAQIIATASAFVETDLLCYPTDAPQELRDVQDRLWLPLLEKMDWPFRQADGLTAVAQDPGVRRQATAWLESLEPFTLTAVTSLIEASGSFVLSYGLVMGLWDLATVSEACMLEERYSLKKWGSDEEAEQLLAWREADLSTLAQMLHLLR